jgi:glycosyltransferase involved in cell wall biosynthesis
MLALYNHVAPVAMSAFGRDELRRLLGRDVPLALHGVNQDFRPITPTDPGIYKGKAVQTADAAKDALDLTGRTVILRTDRYIFRKNYPAFFRILRPVLAAHPEAVAIVHTPLGDDVGYGDIRESISREPGATWRGGLEWEHPQIRLTRAHDSFRGVSDAELRILYSTADLYVSPTMAEGFGLCLAESLACGTPVVANDYSAVGEVVGPGGILVPPKGLLTNGYAHEWSLADEPAMSAAVERLVSKPALRRSLGAEGRRHVARFTWDAAVAVFDELLKQPAAVAA